MCVLLLPLTAAAPLEPVFLIFLLYSAYLHMACMPTRSGLPAIDIR